jgi:hypothetical protein
MSESERDRAELDAWRAAYRETQAAGGSACPDEEALVGLVLGESDGSDRDALVEHVIGCSRCSEHWRMLRQVHIESRPSLSPGPLSWRRLVAVAAGLALFGLGTLLLLEADLRLGPRLWPATPEVQRGSSEPAEIPLTEPADGAQLIQRPQALSWRPPQEVQEASYRVSLLDAELQPIHRSPSLRDPRWPLPEDVRLRLRSGQRYFWTVEVSTPDRRVLGPFSFSIEPDRR